MDEKTEKNLWEELKLLQAIIDKFDKVSLQFKTWFITTFTAVAGIGIAREQRRLLWVNVFLVCYFLSVGGRLPRGTRRISRPRQANPRDATR